MDDKFSKLILLLQSKIRNTEEHREEILQRKSDISTKITQTTTDIKSEEELLYSLKKDLKIYERFPLKVLGSILYMILTLGIVTIILLYLVFYFSKLFTMLPNIGLDLLLILPCITTPAVGVVVYVIFKGLYGENKKTIQELKETKKLRKKYKQSDEIQKEIELVKEVIGNLTSQLETMRAEENDCNIALEEIGYQITVLEKKLGIVKDVFVENSFKVHSRDAEQQLDIEYDHSNLDNKISELDTEPGKRFII